MGKLPRYLVDYPCRSASFPFYMKVQEHRTVTPHRSDFLVVLLVVRGRGTQLVNGMPYRTGPGTMTFLLPYQIHELASDPDDVCELYVCNFGMDLLLGMGGAEQGLLPLLAERSGTLPPYVRLEGESYARMLGLFAEMFAEYRSDDGWSSILVKAKLFEALARFDRLRQSGTAPAPGTRMPSQSIWRVVHHIHEHYREPLALEGLAERFHFHATYLSELFKRTMGRSFVHFLQEVRIRNACSLLLSTELSVTEVALEAGFGSINTFFRVFRRLKGTTPTEYRKARATEN